MMGQRPAGCRLDRATDHVMLPCLFYFIPETIRRIIAMIVSELLAALGRMDGNRTILGQPRYKICTTKAHT